MPAPPINLKSRGLAAFLAWLVPGLGHLYQGRRGKAALYFLCITGLFVAGMVMGEWKIVFWRWVHPLSEDFRIWYPAQFWAGLLAFPALVQATLAHYNMGPWFGGYLAEPALNVINGLHNTAGRYVDVGIVYTCIAGLLNVLAIYDAYEGPALVDDPEAQPAPRTETKIAPPAVLEPAT
jgi:hypothetical protein